MKSHLTRLINLCYNFYFTDFLSCGCTICLVALNSVVGSLMENVNELQNKKDV